MTCLSPIFNHVSPLIEHQLRQQALNIRYGTAETFKTDPEIDTLQKMLKKQPMFDEQSLQILDKHAVSILKGP